MKHLGNRREGENMGTASSKHLLIKSELTGGPRALEAPSLPLSPTPEASCPCPRQPERSSREAWGRRGGYSARVSHVLWLVEATSHLLPCGKRKGSHGLSHSVAGSWPSQSESPQGGRRGSLS